MRPQSILIVTDEPLVMRMITQVLQRFDRYIIHQAANYQEAIAAMAEIQELDIVLTDYDLGSDYTGRDIFTIAYQKGARLRLMSGYRSSHKVVVEVLKQFPTARFLEKPFDIEHLDEFLIGGLH